jgi:hypothetical protein
MWRDLHMLMWVVVGIHKCDVEVVLKTYHTLMLHPLSSMLYAMPQVGDFLLATNRMASPTIAPYYFTTSVL